MRIATLDENTAYIGASLFLPKKKISEKPVRNALTFVTEAGNERILVEDHPHHLEVPRRFLAKEAIETGLNIPVVDLRPTRFKQVDMEPRPEFSIRPDQKEPFRVLTTSGDGVLNLACGKGKTFLALMLANHLKAPFLVVSPQGAHLKNWEDELHKFLNFRGTVGKIYDNCFEWECDAVFATVQGLANLSMRGDLPPEFYTRFGLTIYDECHHLSAEYFARSSDVSAGRRLGLTASRNRIDRLEQIFYYHIGPILYSDLSQELEPKFEVVRTGIQPSPEEEKEFLDVNGQRSNAKIFSWLAKHPERNKLIHKEIQKRLDEGRQVYCATHSKEHTKAIVEPFPDGAYINGDVKDHEDRMARLQSCNPVAVTYNVGSEAYNKQTLDTLIIATPFVTRQYAPITYDQTTGRILRPLPGKKQPIVVIFWDEHIEEADVAVRSTLQYAANKGHEVPKEGIWRQKRKP